MRYINLQRITIITRYEQDQGGKNKKKGILHVENNASFAPITVEAVI